MKKWSSLFCILLLLHIALFAQENNLPATSELKTDIQIEFTIIAIPFLGVQTPKAKSTFNARQISPDIENGAGFHTYLGLNLMNYFDSESFYLGCGFLFQESYHDSSLDLYKLSVSSYEFEINANNRILNNKKYRFSQKYGISFGFSRFDYDHNYEDFTSGIASFRYMLKLELIKYLYFSAGGGIYVWGAPSETLAYGGYLMIGIGCQF